MCSHIDLCPAGEACRCAQNLPKELQPWLTSEDPRETKDQPSILEEIEELEKLAK